MTIELRQLRYFVALADTLHFGRAATQLHITQPPLSRQIAALEDMLGVALFVRSSRQVELTAAGRHFHAQALHILAALDTALRSTQATARGERGVLRVGFTMSAAWNVLPALIRRYGDAFPAAEIQLMDVDGREQKLKDALEPLRADYDYILIDCPPALSLLTLNALTAADSVIVPMQCEYYALEGLSALMETIEALRQRLNPGLEIEGVLRTMFDVRNNLANAVSAELTNHFGELVFRTIIPRNVRLAEAPSHGQSIIGYDKGSRGGVAYLGLAGEVLRRQRERKQASTEKAA